MAPESRNPIYTYRLDDGGRFDITLAPGKVTPKRYRFVKCASLLERKIEIYEYETLPPPSPYTVLSHVWYGNKDQDGAVVEGSFEVEDKLFTDKASGPPISFHILKHACKVAQAQGDLIWIDRLCINKSNEDDHSWQMIQMHDIYKKSKLCIVFPDGLARLTPLDEETKWIDRGWTLQEAVAPSNVQVMFEPGTMNLKIGLEVKAFPLDSGGAQSHGITKISDGCAMAPLLLLLDCTIKRGLMLESDNGLKHKVSIFGTAPEANDEIDHRLVLPNVAALAVILKERLKQPDQPNLPNHTGQPGQLKQCDPKQYVYHHCLWKSTMMRSTRDPVDIIFSVMGLFDGIQMLDPSDYRNKSDCVRPAIELARRILVSSSGAAWLGVSCFSPPCSELSTFPSFPRVRGKDRFPTVAIPGNHRVQASQLMLNEYPDIRAGDRWNIYVERIDTNGYLLFSGMSAPICEGSNQAGTWLPAINYDSTSTSSIIWYEHDLAYTGGHDASKTFAVLLGFFMPYSPDPSDVDVVKYKKSNLRGFIIAPDITNQGKHVLKSYFMLNSNTSTWDWVGSDAWESRKFEVGGPLNNLVSDYVKEKLGRFEKAVEPKPQAASTRPAHQKLSGPVTGFTSGGDVSVGYNMVGGNPWQSEGSWTEKEMNELRDLLNKKN